MKKAALEEALAYGNSVCSFSLEDTVDRCYRDVVDALQSEGWTKVPYRKRSKVEKKRFPNKDAPRLIWTISENDVDFADLQADQMVNHFEGIHELTTKQGFADIVRDAAQVSADPSALSLRTYNLGDPVQKNDFIDDFRLSAAVNILKIYLSDRNSSILNPSKYTQLVLIQRMNKDILRYSMHALTWHIRVNIYGEWPGVDISKIFKDKDYPLEDDQWQDILDFSYELSLLDREDEWVEQSRIIHSVLELERQMAGRTVQKYLEAPLLFKRIKFDLRIWVLLLDWEGGHVRGEVYGEVYGRRCGKKWDDNVEGLTDSYKHLTNYSLQKKRAKSAGVTRTKSATDDDGNQSAQIELLLNQGELFSCLQCAYEERKAAGLLPYHLLSLDEPANIQTTTTTTPSSSPSPNPDTFLSVPPIWSAHIFPLIKARLSSVLQLSAQKLESRSGSFEFLGFDVILDVHFTPYILEVNLSPAMAHRSAYQSSLIRDMARGLVRTVLRRKASLLEEKRTEEQEEESGDVRVDNWGWKREWVPLTNPSLPSSGGVTTIAPQKVLAPDQFWKEKRGGLKDDSHIFAARAVASPFVLPAARPKTAGLSRSSSMRAPQVDDNPPAAAPMLNLVVVGKAISVDAMDTVDRGCNLSSASHVLNTCFYKASRRWKVWHDNREQAAVEIHVLFDAGAAKGSESALSKPGELGPVGWKAVRTSRIAWETRGKWKVGRWMYLCALCRRRQVKAVQSWERAVWRERMRCLASQITSAATKRIDAQVAEVEGLAMAVEGSASWLCNEIWREEGWGRASWRVVEIVDGVFDAVTEKHIEEAWDAAIAAQKQEEVFRKQREEKKSQEALPPSPSSSPTSFPVSPRSFLSTRMEMAEEKGESQKASSQSKAEGKVQAQEKEGWSLEDFLRLPLEQVISHLLPPQHAPQQAAPRSPSPLLYDDLYDMDIPSTPMPAYPSYPSSADSDAYPPTPSPRISRPYPLPTANPTHRPSPPQALPPRRTRPSTAAQQAFLPQALPGLEDFFTQTFLRCEDGVGVGAGATNSGWEPHVRVAPNKRPKSAGWNVREASGVAAEERTKDKTKKIDTAGLQSQGSSKTSKKAAKKKIVGADRSVTHHSKDPYRMFK
eukprot:gene31696-38307_t